MPLTIQNKNKYNSATTVQKTLKEEATTYYAKLAIGADGTGSLVTADGASKGVVTTISPGDGSPAGEYVFVFENQKQWLGAPSVAIVSGSGPGDTGADYTYSVIGTYVDVDLSGLFPELDSPVAAVGIKTYEISGSGTANTLNVLDPPSGSFILLTIAGTKSPVF